MKALDLIKAHEGLRLFPYKDTDGSDTIGYGFHLDRLTHEQHDRLVAAHGGTMVGVYKQGITPGEASLLTDDVVRELEAWANATFPWFRGLSETRRAVIVDMAYELGEGRPGKTGLLAFTHFLAAMEHGDYLQAASAMKSSRWAIQVPAPAAKPTPKAPTAEERLATADEGSKVRSLGTAPSAAISGPITPETVDSMSPSQFKEWIKDDKHRQLYNSWLGKEED